jgi:hypothetical protein
MQDDDKVDELLRKIELQWNSIEALERQVKKKKALMLEDSQVLLSYMDILQTKTLKRPNGFKAAEKIYIDFVITDAKALFAWLKSNLSPDEVIELLTPPTKTKDLRQAILKKYDSCLNTVDGILIKNEYITLNFSYPKTEKEHQDGYKKENEQRKGFIGKRPYTKTKSK